jgi:LacI family transcriptional regulator
VKRIALSQRDGLLDGITAFKRDSVFTWEVPLLVESSFNSAEQLLELGIEGLIGPVRDLENAMELRQLGIPVVNISLPLPGLPGVCFDYQHFGVCAAEHFLDRGFQHFYFFSYFQVPVFLERQQGFAATLKKAGHRCVSVKCEVRNRGAQRFRHLSLDPDALVESLRSLNKPAAIFAANDYCGFNILAACSRAGLRVPEDIAVLACDNETQYCELSTPTLSSIDRNNWEVGYQAGRMLENLLLGHKPKPLHLRIPAKGVALRESSDLQTVHHPRAAAALRLMRADLRSCSSVQAVAEQLGMARRSLERDFRDATGLSLLEMLQKLRLEAAERLLHERPDFTVERVALDAGFPNVISMQKAFRDAHGLSAAEFRARSQEQ